MLREDCELLADLKRICNEAGVFALEYMACDLTIESEEAYALRLVDLGERLLVNAKGRKELKHNGEPTPLVIDAEFVRVEYEGRGLRELLPGSTTSDGGS